MHRIRKLWHIALKLCKTCTYCEHRKLLLQTPSTSTPYTVPLYSEHCPSLFRTAESLKFVFALCCTDKVLCTLSRDIPRTSTCLVHSLSTLLTSTGSNDHFLGYTVLRVQGWTHITKGSWLSHRTGRTTSEC